MATKRKRSSNQHAKSTRVTSTNSSSRKQSGQKQSATKPSSAKVSKPKVGSSATTSAAEVKTKPALKTAAKPVEKVKVSESPTPAKNPESKKVAVAPEPAAKQDPQKKATKAATVAEPKPSPTAQEASQAKPESVPEPKSAARAETAAKPEAVAKTKHEADAEPKPAAEPKAKASSTSEAATDPKPVTEAKPAPHAESTPKPASTAKSTKEVETVSDEKPEATTEANESEPVPDAGTNPQESTAGNNAPTEDNSTEPDPLPEPRRSVAFIGSECYPFVKTGGLGDVMYSLPKALIAQNCDVKVIIPNYACIKQEWKDKMVYRGSFNMDLCSDGHSYYVGIMEYVADSGVVYDFIDNQEFFTAGNPYINLVDDIPKFCYFSKAALAALNYMNWIPDVIHCHDWQASLVPIYLRTMFNETPVARAKTVLTIHNLRFQGVYNIPTLKYWTNLPDYVFNKDVLQEFWTEANMLKGGITYANMVTTVSNTYAHEIQTPEYGEGLDAHLRYHSGKLRGIVNGIDYDLWNPATDKLLEAPYDSSDALEQKRKNKLALQKELGLEQDPDKMMIGLVSRLTNQKGLDLVNSVLPAIIDGNTQVVILGTGEPDYENSFRYYENKYKGQVCSNIMYDEGRAHKIYAGADAILVPSRFEPCGLTQLIAMHYGTVPIVRETGGLKDTVQPYNKYTNDGNGFTFDRYEAGLLYDAINRAKTLYFTNRPFWDQMVQRDMAKDVSWDNSARQYRWLYLELTA